MPTEEKLTLTAACQYNDFKGFATSDEHASPSKRSSPIYTPPEGMRIIGWEIDKCNHDAPVHIKLMCVEEQFIQEGKLDPKADTIYLKELKMSIEDFINDLGRLNIVVLRTQLENNLGREFTFVRED